MRPLAGQFGSVVSNVVDKEQLTGMGDVIHNPWFGSNFAAFALRRATNQLQLVVNIYQRESTKEIGANIRLQQVHRQPGNLLKQLLLGRVEQRFRLEHDLAKT